MAISHNIPSTTKKPGEFHQFDFTSSAQSLVSLPNRILLIGVQGSTATGTADEFQQVFDEQQADLAFEQGSSLALMCRKALETGRRIGVQPEIYAAGVADPAGTAAAFTITVTAGTAAVAGDVVFRVAGRTLRAGVSAGDNQDTVAAAIKDAIDANLVTLPITAAVVTNVVTLTANYTGVNGDDIVVTVDDVGNTGLTVTPAQTVSGAGVADPTTALANSLSKLFEVVVLDNHAAQDITDLKSHLDSAWAPAAKRWAFAMIADNSSLSTANTRSAAANDERIAVISYEDSPSLPGEIAASMAVAVSSQAQPNYNWDFFDIPLFIPPDSSVYTDTEIESALAAGTTPLAPDDQRSTTQIVRLVTTKTLEGGNPFDRLRDLATLRGLVYVTRQIDAAFTSQFRGKNKSQRVLDRMRSVAFNVLKQLETLEVVQNVDALFPQLLIETDPLVSTRAVASIPESIIPNLHQIVMKHVLFVE